MMHTVTVEIRPLMFIIPKTTGMIEFFFQFILQITGVFVMLELFGLLYYTDKQTTET